MPLHFLLILPLSPGLFIKVPPPILTHLNNTSPRCTESSPVISLEIIAVVGWLNPPLSAAGISGLERARTPQALLGSTVLVKASAMIVYPRLLGFNVAGRGVLNMEGN